MPEAPELPIPVEIPWKLASTTQVLEPGFPEDTTVSLFYYEPPIEALHEVYDGERLVYLKATVSISPCAIDDRRASELARAHLTGSLPVIHALLDLAVSPVPFTTGGMRPYFHAASPTRRTMVETGVVGDAVYEGASENVAIGRSASQLHEAMRSNVTTSSAGWSVGLPGIARGGVRTTRTAVEGERTEEQYIETVMRDASEERRELLSHTTSVKNVLTLLHAKHVGSPFLRFSLSPRPLRPLTLDPGDPNLWYSQLLHARSSGIEGMQEFIAVVAVPRGADFCVEALLRRICVLDVPPTPPVPPKGYAESDLMPADYQRMLDYLHDVYPRGTPVDTLDVDVLAAYPAVDPNAIPVIRWWGTLDEIVVLNAAWPHQEPSGGPIYVQEGQFNYKLVPEVWLDMLRHEYMVELARSPLERGVVLSHRTGLRTCFSAPADHEVTVGVVQAAGPQVSRVPFEPTLSYQQPHRRFDARTPDEPRPLEAVIRWNVLVSELDHKLSSASGGDEQPLTLGSPRVVELLLRRWAQLDDDDRRNLSLAELGAVLRLSSSMQDRLCELGATNLARLAHTLLRTPRIHERVAAQVRAARCPPPVTRVPVVPLAADASLTREQLEQIRQAITAALQGPGAKAPGARASRNS